MARGKTFGQVVTMTRQEAGHSTHASPGRNVADVVEQTVRRVYERLHDDFAWPHLLIQRDMDLAAGQRIYSFPGNLDPDRVGDAWVLEDKDTVWRPVAYGIGAEHWNAYNPDRDERADPVRAWQRYEGDMIEVWPTPLTSHGKLRIEGMPFARELNNTGDRIDIDANLIALYAAGEILLRQGSSDAEAKLEQARSMYDKLRANSQKSDPVFALNPRRSRPAPVTRVRAPRT